MNRIAEQVERDPNYAGIINAQRSEPEATGADAISLAARQIAETLKLAAIVTYTASGTTGLRAARERPQVPIIALSPVLDTARRLSMVWGTHCVVSPGRQRPRRHGRPRLPHRLRGRLRQAGRPRHHHRRRAAQDARARPTCCASPMSARKAARRDLNRAASRDESLRRQLSASAPLALVQMPAP